MEIKNLTDPKDLSGWKYNKKMCYLCYQPFGNLTISATGNEKTKQAILYHRTCRDYYLSVKLGGDDE
jgi:hypothetical protein